MDSSHAERMIFWHSITGDHSLIQVLEVEDIADPDTRKVLVVAKDVLRQDGDVSPLTINLRLQSEEWYQRKGGLAYVIELGNPMYAGSPRQVLTAIKKHRALREAAQFSTAGMPADQIPANLMNKAREVSQLLLFDAAPMQTLGEELSRPIAVLPTGFHKMDTLLGGGLELGSLNVIAARPSQGKTTLGVNIAAKAIQAGKSVLFISLEMPKVRIAERALCCLYKKRPADIRQNAGHLLAGLSGELIIEDRISSLPAIESLIAHYPDVDLIIIDYFQLISVKNKEGKQFQLEETSNRLKQAAMAWKKPIVLPAQLNREIEREKVNREPFLSDIRGTGALEQDADVVTFLWDPDAKEESGRVNPYAGVAKVVEALTDTRHLKWIVRKNRNGNLGTVDMVFRPSCFSFTEIPNENEEIPPSSRKTVIQNPTIL